MTLAREVPDDELHRKAGVPRADHPTRAQYRELVRRQAPQRARTVQRTTTTNQPLYDQRAVTFSIVAMLVGGIALTPLASVARAVSSSEFVRPGSSSGEPKSEIQAFVSSSSPAGGLERPGGFDVESATDLARHGGVSAFTDEWITDPSSQVQWPFPVSVPISAPYGSASYLAKFARPHRGVDLIPGAGAAVGAVAQGTVRVATEAGGDYGVTAVIDHIIDSERVSTRYGHLARGSLRVRAGDVVKAGQSIGMVGSTGRSTGPHLHLEVLLRGNVPTDPMAWIASRSTR